MQKKSKKRFKRIYVEITNVCNLSCTFCPKTKRHSQFMTASAFESVCKKIKDYTDYIYLHILGEPLLNDDIFQILNVAGDNGLIVNLTTNGMLLQNEQVFNKLLAVDNGLIRKITFSLHSFEANFRECAENQKKLKNYLDAITNFVNKRANKANEIFEFRLWNGNSLHQKFDEYIISHIFKEFGENDCSQQLQLKQSNKIRNNIYLEFAEEFGWPDDKQNNKTNEAVFCYGLKSQIGILCDGTIVPCCLDNNGTIDLGNIFETDLNSVLQSERVKNIINGFSNRKAVEKLCSNCEYAKRF